jgi:DNA mismatch repair protein MutS
MNLSPMMRQYEDAKKTSGDALLLFRMGDFYELFHDDAKVVARVLGLTLTSRDKGENPVPMAGFPHHQLEGYIGKLIRAGYRVAVCEQVEDPKTAKGIVRREVQRIVSAGTLTDEALLDPRSSNLLVSVCREQGKSKRAKSAGLDAKEGSIGIAWVELSTGRFEANTIDAYHLEDELARLDPSEIVVSEADRQLFAYQEDNFKTAPGSRIPTTVQPDWHFHTDQAVQALHKHFNVSSLEGMGWGPEDSTAIRAAGAAMTYLVETQRISLDHISTLKPARESRYLEIDASTRRSLEIAGSIRSGARAGTLLECLDSCITPNGSRCLAQWLAAPLIDVDQINLRLDSVAEFVRDNRLRETLRSLLDESYDLNRLVSRVATGRCGPRDLQQIGATIRVLPRIKALLELRVAPRLQQLHEQIELQDALAAQLADALADQCPLLVRDGGFIRSGYDGRLDELKELAGGGKQWIARYQAEQIQATGITSLKVGYTSVFGYYLEVTNTHRERIPANFVRKQTLKNAERYITEELKEYEEKILGAEQKARDVEYELFVELRELVHQAMAPLQRAAAILAELDVLSGFAENASKRNYVRPAMTDEPILELFEARHPVLDAMMPHGKFTPNDTTLGSEFGRLHLITGPNMAGKSTYIRQVALIVIMAQVGSFVPANRATVGVADRVFARVGASDELSRGQSTFMVEMVETARILHTATKQSLVILDEVGRGTSTYDGLSLAWAIVEYLHDHADPRTLFATHYHELIDLQRTLPGVRNFNVAVKEWDENIIFLHRIIPGGADRSYGIHVARLAGIPGEVNDRAREILAQLEIDNLQKKGQARVMPSREKKQTPIQMTLFQMADHPVVERLRKLSLDNIEAGDALQLLRELHSEANGGE